MNNVSVGQIGCGHWGKNIARNLINLGVLNKIYDANLDQLKTLGFNKSLHCKYVDEILNDEKINCIVISSPAKTHANYAIEALSKNKHVFIEKPFTLSLKDANSIVNVAKKNNKIVFVGHLLHYHNAFIELKKQINNGIIGNVNVIKANRLNFGAIRSNESVLYDLASHDISMILSIVEDLPNEIQVNSIFKNSSLFPDILNIMLRFPNGTFANINSNWINPYKEHKFTVLGSKGSLIFDDTKEWKEKLCFNPSYINQDLSINQKNINFLKLTEEEPLKKELESLINCINYDKKPMTDCYEALKVQTVMDEIDDKIKYQN